MSISKQVQNIGMAAAIGAASVLSSSALNAATVTFEGGDVVIDESAGTFTLNLVATDLDFTTASVGLGIQFDTTKVSFSGAAIDPFWNVAPTATNPTADTYEFYAASLAGLFGLGPSTVSQGVASITFDIVVPGTFDFVFYSVGAVGDWGYAQEIVAPGDTVGVAYCMTLTLDSTTCVNDSADPANKHLLLDPTSVTITPAAVVPVPAAVWLFGSGLIGMVAVSRRKKTA